MEEDALVAGVPFDLFWGDMTPKLLKKFMKAHSRRLQEVDMLNHTLGSYIATGVNDPRHYPNEPLLSKENGDTNLLSFDEYEKLARIKYGKK